ncbi:nuclear transport factor 2 family protein [Kistimonas asteriae]|uniref:nuclear transport factor 2 family protein n=1 Tax=Kistimonas asteriae TaxID=517724 RepID=UPI001BAA4B82|nr:nuclear transport factor 2 family protein [Kistimonas asteriae]
MSVSNINKVIALLNSIETGDPEPATHYANKNQYTQHNLAVADGLQGFAELLQALPENTARVNVVRAFSDGDYVFTHTDYNFFGPKVGFDIFRFENGLIVEHWDNLTEKASAKNPSGHTQTDGSTETTDRDKTAENKQRAASFIETILIGGHFDKISEFIDPGESNYIQHNPVIADGIDGLLAAIKHMAQQGITMAYKKNHKVLGEGNFTLGISEGEFAGDHVAYYDLLRFDNNKIVEHWGAIETIPPKSEWRNSNGKFEKL